MIDPEFSKKIWQEKEIELCKNPATQHSKALQVFY